MKMELQYAPIEDSIKYALNYSQYLYGQYGSGGCLLDTEGNYVEPWATSQSSKTLESTYVIVTLTASGSAGNITVTCTVTAKVEGDYSYFNYNYGNNPTTTPITTVHKLPGEVIYSRTNSGNYTCNYMLLWI